MVGKVPASEFRSHFEQRSEMQELLEMPINVRSYMNLTITKQRGVLCQFWPASNRRLCRASNIGYVIVHISITPGLRVRPLNKRFEDKSIGNKIHRIRPRGAQCIDKKGRLRKSVCARYRESDSAEERRCGIRNTRQSPHLTLALYHTPFQLQHYVLPRSLFQVYSANGITSNAPFDL